MATEIAHESAAARGPLTMEQGVDKLSGILSRGQPDEAPEPVTSEIEAQTEDPSQLAEPVEEPESEEAEPEPEARAEETEEAPDAPAKEAKPKEPEVTSEIELEPAQVAELLGLEDGDIEVDDDGAIQLHAKIDGKPAKVSLRDLRHSYELAQTHEERLRELGRDRKAFKEQSTAVLESMSTQNQQMAQAVQALEEDYATNFQAVDWTTLRAEDPTEYNAKRLDYDDRRRRIEEYRARVMQQHQQLNQEHMGQLQTRQAEGKTRLAEEFSKPEYRSAAKWDDAESEKLGKWMMDRHEISAQQLALTDDWRIFKWARDSYLREQELQAAKESVRKVVKLPKVTKPGTVKAPNQVKKGQREKLKVRQRNSGGGIRESTDLIRNILDR